MKTEQEWDEEENIRRLELFRLKSDIITNIFSSILSVYNKEYNYFDITSSLEFSIIETMVNNLIDQCDKGTLERDTYGKQCDYCNNILEENNG